MVILYISEKLNYIKKKISPLFIMMINKVEIFYKVKFPDNYPNIINNILGNIPGIINVR